MGHSDTTKPLAILAGLGGLLTAVVTGVPAAAADPLDDATAASAPDICAALDDTPTVAGVETVVMALHAQGYSALEAGQIIGRAVTGWCPDHTREIRAFIHKWSPAVT